MNDLTKEIDSIAARIVSVIKNLELMSLRSTIDIF